MGVRVGGGAREQADAAGAGVGEVVEDVEYGGLVVVVDPGGDGERAGRAAVGDDRQACRTSSLTTGSWSEGSMTTVPSRATLDQTSWREVAGGMTRA